MKLVKGIRYGLRPITRIYLGNNIIYDTRSFILKHAHATSDDGVAAFADLKIPMKSGMICTVDMYAIANPTEFDDVGVSAKLCDSPIAAYATCSFDDLLDCAGHGQSALYGYIESIANGVVATAENSAAIGYSDISTVGVGANILSKKAFGKWCGCDIANGYGINIPVVNAVSIDDRICVTTAALEINKITEIFSRDSCIVASTGFARNVPAIKTAVIDGSVVKTISFGKNCPVSATAIHGALNDLTSAHANSDTVVITDAHSKLKIELMSSANAAPLTIGSVHGALNAVSHLDAENATQSDVSAHGSVNIKTTLGNLNEEQIAANSHAIINEVTKSKMDNVLPRNVSLSSFVDARARANTITWMYPDQEGDVLFIFQAYDTNYNEETGTLEII